MYRIDKEFGTGQNKGFSLKGGTIAATSTTTGRQDREATMHSTKTSTASSSLMKKRGSGYGNSTTAIVPSRGPAITTNIDEQSAQYQHQFKHEKTIEAVITDYPGVAPASATPHERLSYDRSLVVRKSFRNGGGDPIPVTQTVVAVTTTSPGHDRHDLQESYQQVTRNKRISTEILGSSVESTKTSQRGPSGHRRITTHIVRKVTTLSRAEEQQLPPEDLLPPAKMVRSSELEYRHTLPRTTALPAIEPASSTSTTIRRTKVIGQEACLPAKANQDTQNCNEILESRKPFLEFTMVFARDIRIEI